MTLPLLLLLVLLTLPLLLLLLLLKPSPVLLLWPMMHHAIQQHFSIHGEKQQHTK